MSAPNKYMIDINFEAYIFQIFTYVPLWVKYFWMEQKATDNSDFSVLQCFDYMRKF